MKLPLFLTILLVSTSCSFSPAKKIFVSPEGSDLNDGSRSQPVRTLETAQKLVREFKKTDAKRNIRVILSEGTWYLTQPLKYSAADGGSKTSEVTWEGAPDGKTILSGGRIILNFHDAGFGLWWANIDPTDNFEQLYINGMRATRARTPNLTDSLPRIFLNKSVWKYNSDSTVSNITVQVSDRGYFKDLSPVGEFELVVFKDWTTSRFRASGLSSNPAEVYLKPPFALFDGPYNSIFAGNANRYSCFLEGDPSFLDEPGEWALDHAGNKVYYKPLPGQTPEGTTVIAAFAEQILILEGTRENQLKYLNFSNISFQHAAYLLPEFSHDGAQACFYYPGKSESSESFRTIPQAIHLKWTAHCHLVSCTITNTAGNGIFIEEGCYNNVISNTLITGFGGNGIMIGLPVDPKTDTPALPVGNLVYNTTIHSGGLCFQGAVGIWLGFCANSQVSSSEIYDMPYTGISVGWQWNPQPSSSRENRILNNQIHHVMQVLGDGGGIYTLGYQPGSIIEGNDIHDILRSELNHASPNNGMFIDEGSKGYLIENNTIRNTAHTCIRGHRTAGVELSGNTFYSDSLPAISHTPPYDAMIFAGSNTTIRWTNPGWPKEWGYGDTVTAFTMDRNKFLHQK